MTSIAEASVKCAVCRRTSVQEILLSSIAIGSPDLDFRPPVLERDTLELWLQQCPHCGYCAPDLKEKTQERAIVKSRAYQSMLNESPFPPIARKFLARAMLVDAADPAAAADSLLNAAWACDDRLSQDLATECRRMMISTLARARPFADSNLDCLWGSIAVDALRRSGDFAQAKAESNELLSRDGVPPAVRRVLEFQLQLIASQDLNAHTMDECEAPAS